MKTTVIGDYRNFAAASRVAAELMIAGFAQAEISIVGRDESRFAFAGALAQGLSGAREHDFVARLVAGLSHLCVPPRAAIRHAGALAQAGGIVAIQSDRERAQRALGIMRRHGPVERYSAGAMPMARAGLGRVRATIGLAHVPEPT